MTVPTVRTAALRARMASASPRITRSMVADASGYSVGYVKNVLSDNTAGADVTEALDRIEAAVVKIEGSRDLFAPVPTP